MSIDSRCFQDSGNKQLKIRLKIRIIYFRIITIGHSPRFMKLSLQNTG